MSAPDASHLGGRYRLDDRLGEGAFGEVRAGWDIRLDRPVAVKILRPGRAGDADAVRRFAREARITARLRSPHAVPIHDVGQTADGRLFMVMERVEGRTLRAALRGGALPPARALAVVDQICALLVEAHAAGLVHRDLKPENVMLDRAADGAPRARVLDFGVAKVADGAGPSTRGLVGTPAYIAPEIWAEAPVDGRTDLYAVGLILHELIGGAPAVAAASFHGAARAHLFDALPRLAGGPPGVQAVVDALTARDPADRPADAAAARRLIAPLLGGGAVVEGPPVSAPPVEASGLGRAETVAGGTLAGADSLDGRPPPERRRWRGPAGALAVTLGLGALAALGLEAPADAPRASVTPVAVEAAPDAAAPVAPDRGPMDATPDAAPAPAPDAAVAGRVARPAPRERVSLSATPAGARVWHGSTLLGTAPMEIPVARPMTVVVEAPEHYGRRVRLRPGQGPVQVGLEPVVRLK